MFKNRKISNIWLFSFAADVFAIAAAYYTTLLIRFHSEWGAKIFDMVRQVLKAGGAGMPGEEHELFYIIGAPRIILFITVVLCVLYALMGLYPGKKFIRKQPVTWNVIVANVIAITLFYAYFYLRRNVFHPRSIFATVLFLNVIYCVLFRGLMDDFLAFIRSRFGVDQSLAILAGSGQEADWIYWYIEEFCPHGVRIVERINWNSSDSVDPVADPSVDGFEKRLKALGDCASRHGANLIILAEKGLSVGKIMRFLELCSKLDVSAKILSDKLDVLVSRAGIESDVIRGIPLVNFDLPSRGKRFAAVRRFISTVFAFSALVLFLPVIGLIALLIKLTSRGPVFFMQERIGVNRRPFMMYKFRTMYDKADEAQAEVEEFNESGAGLFKMRRDPRVTPVGRLLRRFSLDELPQLVNVLRGDMTVVGPRPLPRRDFEHYYEDWHYSRHEGLPGLTCLWQVSGRSDIDFHNMCILDVYYLRNRNWVLDLRILLRTIIVVLFAKGAY